MRLDAFIKGFIMKTINAANFLKYLHTLETKFSASLLTQEQKSIVEDVRATFLKEYRGN